MASTNKYIAGGVANFLAAVCSNDDSSKVSNDVKKLSNLFREPVQRKKVSPDQLESIEAIRRKKEKVELQLIKTSPKNKSQSYSEIENVLENETYIDMETTTSENTSPEIRKPSYDPEKLKKTIFVGNLPIAITRKKVVQLFKKFGHKDIVSVRLRNAVSADPKISKRGAAIKREFHPNQKTINAYVVFSSEEAASKALVLNSTEVNGFHIRVDLAGSCRKHDTKKSLFVGNLPFDVEDDTVREHFTDCGNVLGVRIVRDPRTRIGKGFGFVTFDNADSVSLALEMKNKKLNGRELRLQRCEKNLQFKAAPKKQKTKPKQKNIDTRKQEGNVKKFKHKRALKATNKSFGNRKFLFQTKDQPANNGKKQLKTKTKKDDGKTVKAQTTSTKNKVKNTKVQK